MTSKCAKILDDLAGKIIENRRDFQVPDKHGRCPEVPGFEWLLDYIGNRVAEEAFASYKKAVDNVESPYQSEHRCPHWLVGRSATIDGDIDVWFCDKKIEREKVIDEKTCSYLVYQIRIKTGKEGYSCTSEEDTAGSCCRNGRCVFKDGERE